MGRLFVYWQIDKHWDGPGVKMHWLGPKSFQIVFEHMYG